MKATLLLLPLSWTAVAQTPNVIKYHATINDVKYVYGPAAPVAPICTLVTPCGTSQVVQPWVVNDTNAAGGTTALDGALGWLLPTRLVATTVKV